MMQRGAQSVMAGADNVETEGSGRKKGACGISKRSQKGADNDVKISWQVHTMARPKALAVKKGLTVSQKGASNVS
jgi:hypothetical protein